MGVVKREIFDSGTVGALGDRWEVCGCVVRWVGGGVVDGWRWCGALCTGVGSVLWVRVWVVYWECC